MPKISPPHDSRHAGLLSVWILFLLIAASPLPAFQEAGSGPETGTGADLSLFQDEKNLPVGNAGGNGIPAQPSSDTDSLGRLFLALILAGTVLWALWVILKPGMKTLAPDQGPFENLGSMKLSASVSVHVLRLGKKAWVLSTSPSSTTVLDTIEDEAVIEDLSDKARSFRYKGLLAAQSIPGSPVSRMRHLFQRLIRRLKDPSGSSPVRNGRTSPGIQSPAMSGDPQGSGILRTGLTRENGATETRSPEDILREQRKRLGSLHEGDKQ